jgi:ABC-type lipoprotein export system ATPase subunit
MLSAYPKGSEWRKWDLHVHTPASIVNHFSGSDLDDRWTRFIADLEALPSEFKVIGVNDYLFLDGYRRVRDAKDREGRLKNIDLILPVVELRLDKFVGTDSHWNKVNFHVIFSDSLDADQIQAQFLNALTPSYKVADGSAWSGIPTPDSLIDLGKRLISAAPPEKRADYVSPLVEGFNNLTLPLDRIREALLHSVFDGKHLTAVGKSEWASMCWSDPSIADKRNIMASIDSVFTAAASPEGYATARAKLIEERVNSKLLDCSDAHYNADSTCKDRIGNCFTWVKADPTFEGLKLSVREFDDRVFVGEIPPLLERVRDKRTKFIDCISFAKKSGALLGETWMAGETVRLNPGLVAVIGNKGSGKSALSDTIGLLGKTRQHSHFSFLSGEKFRNPKTGTKAENFTAALTWVSGLTEPDWNLNVDPPTGAAETVQYIPQNYLEKICNEVSDLEGGEFYSELKAVIFSHMDRTERLKDDLDSLVRYRTEASEEAKGLIVAELKALNTEIVALEVAGSPDNRARIEGALALKQQELDAHDGTRPPDEPAPTAPEAAGGDAAVLTEKIAAQTSMLDACVAAIAGAKKALELANRREAAAIRLEEKVANFKRSYDAFLSECATDAEPLGLTVSNLVGVTVDTAALTELKREIAEEQARRRGELDLATPGSPAARKQELENSLTELRAKLDEPARKRQAHLLLVKDWSEERARIVGDKDTTGTLERLEAERVALADIPSRLIVKRVEREKKVREIHKKIAGLAAHLRTVFKGVEEFIEAHEVTTDLAVSFKVDIVPVNLQDNFLALINQKKAGTFCGLDEGREQLGRLIRPVRFEEEDQVVGFLKGMEDALKHDLRTRGRDGTDPRELLRKGVTLTELYNYLFSLSYLQPRYVLEWEGKGIDVLSPGEKGTLLLAFYLLMDKCDTPLVIDQPEGNLDNETVYKVLVRCLKDTKKRRQIVIVTHNPNLAVVCDADQVVYASINKQTDHRITYESGALENPAISAHVVDVLEGTKPAFRNRDDKYDAVASARTSPSEAS